MKTTTPRGLTVINEDVYADGGYSNLVTHFGLKFTAHFVNGKVTVYGLNGPYLRIKRGYLESSTKAVRDFTVARIREQGPAFIEAHKALYHLDTVAL